MIGKVVASTLAMQAVIVMASLTAPVLASVIAPELGVPPHVVGYYSALIYGVAAMTSLATPGFVRRFGAIRLHQGMLVLAALALAALLAAHVAAFVLSALLLGLAYGPTNPASTVLMARFTPARLHGRVFSLKQTAVPVGVALAGSVTPRLAQSIGWRGAAIAIAASCLALMVVVQRWRGQLDDDRDPRAKLPGLRLWGPARLLVSGPLRELAIACFAFGALQFSFSAVFVTVLTEGARWPLVDAGGVLSLALVLSIVSRVLWGWVADRLGARRVLSLLGLAMSAAAAASAAIGPGWSGPAVLAVAALFGVSTVAWNGVAVAEAVRLAPAGALSEAAAGIIAVTFLGALAGPALFSAMAGVAGSFRPGFLVLAASTATPSLLLLRRRGQSA